MYRISVVIPTWNRAHLIARALDSVLHQSRHPDEIIVVDDGSTDDTPVLVQSRYRRVKLLIQENRGVSAARNSGIMAATGDWIAFLDSDDEWHPKKLERQVQALSHQADFRICHTNEIWIRRGVRVNPMSKHRKYGGRIFPQCLPLCRISPSSILLHRTVFKEAGLFDETLPVCEDYDLWLRICARYPVLYLDEPLVTKYGGHADQLSRMFVGMDRFRIYALEKIIRDPCLDAEDRLAAIKALREKIHIYLAGARKHGNHESITVLEALLDRFPPLTETPLAVRS